MSSGRRTSVVRPAQYTGARWSTPRTPRASAKVVTDPRATSSPAPRSNRAKATAMRSTPVTGAWSAAGRVMPASGTPLDGRPDHLAEPGRPEPLLVLPVLEHRAEGDVDSVLVEVGPSEGGQGRRPVDRLGHARRLVQLHASHELHRPGDLGSQAGRHLRSPQPDDRHLPLEARMLDPVVQAAPFEGV